MENCLAVVPLTTRLLLLFCEIKHTAELYAVVLCLSSYAQLLLLAYAFHQYQKTLYFQVTVTFTVLCGHLFCRLLSFCQSEICLSNASLGDMFGYFFQASTLLLSYFKHLAYILLAH